MTKVKPTTSELCATLDQLEKERMRLARRIYQRLVSRNGTGNQRDDFVRMHCGMQTNQEMHQFLVTMDQKIRKWQNEDTLILVSSQRYQGNKPLAHYPASLHLVWEYYFGRFMPHNHLIVEYTGDFKSIPEEYQDTSQANQKKGAQTPQEIAKKYMAQIHLARAHLFVPTQKLGYWRLNTEHPKDVTYVENADIPIHFYHGITSQNMERHEQYMFPNISLGSDEIKMAISSNPIQKRLESFFDKLQDWK